MGLSFDELVSKLRILLDVPEALTTDKIDHGALQKLMDEYRTDPKDWERFALQEPSKGYTRNGVTDFGQNANLLILVWNPGKGSAIHDHAEAHCVMKILQGELQEEMFEPKHDGPMEMFDKHVLPTDGTTYISDTIGYHRITNRGTSPAVSLHLYTPPYAKKYGCNIFDEESGAMTHVEMSRLYSWQGVVVNGKNYSTADIR